MTSPVAGPRAPRPAAPSAIGQIVPAGAIDPGQDRRWRRHDGAVAMSAENLVLRARDLHGRSRCWPKAGRPTQDGTVWTFKLRQGVKFHNGKTMTADDVVATFDRLADPDNGSNALSVFTGMLSKGGTRKVDDYTVEFHLDAANGNFPYAVSTDNYNAIIVPAEYPGELRDDDGRHRPLQAGEIHAEGRAPPSCATPTTGARRPLPTASSLPSSTTTSRRSWRCRAGRSTSSSRSPCCRASACSTIPTSTSSARRPRPTSRCTCGPTWIPSRTSACAGPSRSASTGRSIVAGLMKGKAQVGNDSPFMAAYPSTDPSVPQREKNIAEAKQLMEAAGMANGFEVTLTTEKYLEIPDYAVLIQNAVKEIGGKIDLNIIDQGAYYGDAVPGKSPWLDSNMGITDYGHRGVPNVFLQAPLTSTGTWNSAHFNNAEYDTLVKSYV